ncbi:MAG: outer membrane beta-barrel protein [Bacteroidota bacterium]
MKKISFVLVLLACSLVVKAQSDNAVNEKRLKFGFNLGVNHSILYAPDELPGFASISNDLGVRLGVLADYQLFEFLSISPKAELSFNNNELNLTFGDNAQYSYEVLPIGLEFMTHFIFKKKNERLSPYLYFGPNLKIPIADKSIDYYGHPDLAIDLGIGFEKAFTQFNFSPELRYSYGFTNVSMTPTIRSMKFHSVSLIFNFM